MEDVMTTKDNSTSLWARMSLARQFALASGLVMLLAAVVVGLWVSSRIEEVVVRNTANATALYMESFFAPLSQDLATQDHLSDANLAELEKLLDETSLGRRVLIFKIWVKGAKVIASSDLDIVGKSFEPTDSLRQAWQGDVAAEFNALNDIEDKAEAALGVPLLEIYSPIRAKGTGEIIAIAERRNRGMSENERAGYEQLRRFSPETYEEVLDFEKKFPDVNGSIIWAMKLKIWRANGVNI